MAENWNGYTGGTAAYFGLSSGSRSVGATFSSTTPVDAIRVQLVNFGGFKIHIESEDGRTRFRSSETLSAPGAVKAWVTHPLSSPIAPGTYRVTLTWVSSTITWISSTSEAYAGSDAYSSSGALAARDYNMQYREFVPEHIPVKRWDGSGWTEASIKKFDGTEWITPEFTITH